MGVFLIWRPSPRLASLWPALLAALLATASPALAQPAELDRQIEAKRVELNEAPLDRRAAIGETLLPLVARRYGPESSEYASELQLHATDLQFARRNADALATMERVVGILTRVAGADSLELGSAQQNYAISLMTNGFKERAVEPYRRYVAILTEIAFGCGQVSDVPGGRIVMGCAQDEKDLGDALKGYGQLLHDLGRDDEGLALFRATIARFEPRWAGCESEAWGTACDRAAFNRRDFLGDYASYLAIAGRLEEAIALRRELTLPRLEALASCAADDCRADYWLLGDFAQWKVAVGDADPAAGRELFYRWLPVLAAEPIHARGAADDADYFDREYRALLDGLLKVLAEDSVVAGETERVRALLAELGKDDILTAFDAAEDFEAQMADLGRRGEALGDYDHAERIVLLKEKAALIGKHDGENSFEYGRALREIATEANWLGDDSQTESYYRRALDVMRGAEGDDSFQTWIILSYLSDWLMRQGRQADAIDTLRAVLSAPANDKSAIYADPAKARALVGGLGALNDPHGPLNELKADFAQLLLQTGGDPAEALAAARHAYAGKQAWRSGFGFSREDETIYGQEDNPYIYGRHSFADYGTFYADAMWSAGSRGEDAAIEAFAALQQVQMSSASAAIARTAAERAIERGGAGALLDERREIDRQVDAIMAEFPPENAQVGDAYQRWSRDNLARQRRLDFRRDEIDRAIRAAAPGYFEYVRPRPLTLAEAKALLTPDQAMLMLVPTEFGTHSVVVTRDALHWHRSDLGRDALTGHVRRLLWDVGANIEVSHGEDLLWSSEGEGHFPYDRGTAYRLYRELVAPHEALLEGKRHLFVAADGVLSSLPLAILVTHEPEGPDGDPAVLRATPWLSERHAIVQLPSLQSLQLLRAVATSGGAADDWLIGFGDPVLEGEAVTRGTSPRQRLTRASGLAVSGGFAGASSGEKRLVDPAMLRALARLPGTRAELLAMGRVFGQRRAELFLGEDATEAKFRKAELERASVLSFATHGLIAGEVDGNTEPGLVLTPPREASVDDDGLLTASEVAGLSLRADWVVLSACNTASGDGRDGAPGLSGLARAFFFAGAKSLLASHWPVQDEVAAIMTVRVLELQQASPEISRAEALQRAMREIRDDQRSDAKATWAHPSAWAPFAYIGDTN